MHGRSFLKLSCLLLTIFFIANPNVSAQSTTTGAITGRVVDPARAIIRNAAILLKMTKRVRSKRRLQGQPAPSFCFPGSRQLHGQGDCTWI